jgi:hypothetical protein
MSYDYIKQVGPPITGPICDFCSSSEVYTSYVAEAHISLTVETEQEKIDLGSDPGWAACKVCSRLIDNDKWKELEDRAVRLFSAGMGMTWGQRQEMRMKVRQIHLRFRDHRKRPA